MLGRPSWNKSVTEDASSLGEKAKELADHRRENGPFLGQALRQVPPPLRPS